MSLRMLRPIAVGLFLLTASIAFGEGTRLNAIERYGLGGHTQAIGLHHGFHIATITPDSAAEKDHLKVHDVILKMDGEAIRSIDHLRAVLAEAYLDGGEITLTVSREGSLEHHVIKCHLTTEEIVPVAKKRRAADEDDAPR